MAGWWAYMTRKERQSGDRKRGWAVCEQKGEKQENVCERKKCTHKRSLSLFFPCSQCTYKNNAANNEDNKQRWTQKDEKLGACEMCMRREAEIKKC